MTTIAYHEGIIAYDSRLTQGPYISQDNFNKQILRNGARFFFTGAPSDYETFIEVYTLANTQKATPNEALVVEKGKLFYCGINAEDGFFKEEWPLNVAIAIGSGGDHAITAIDCGHSARFAVKMAAKRDSRTGGRIRTYTIK